MNERSHFEAEIMSVGKHEMRKLSFRGDVVSWFILEMTFKNSFETSHTECVQFHTMGYCNSLSQFG
jgi:hypothetical protein